MALNSFGFKWEDLNSMKIIPILGGNIKSSYDPPEVVSWVGNARQQQKAEDLLHQLMSALNGNEYFGKKAKIVDVETQVGLGGYGGEIRRPVVYIPEQDTMYIGSSDSSHASVIAEIDKQFLEEYPQGHGYSGDDR